MIYPSSGVAPRTSHALCWPRLRHHNSTFLRPGGEAVNGYGITWRWRAIRRGPRWTAAPRLRLRPPQQWPSKTADRRARRTNLQWPGSTCPLRPPHALSDRPRPTEPAEAQTEWEDMRKVWGRPDRTIRESFRRYIPSGVLHVPCKKPRILTRLAGRDDFALRSRHAPS